jgi:hypothetical protein
VFLFNHSVPTPVDGLVFNAGSEVATVTSVRSAKALAASAKDKVPLPFVCKN